VRKHVIPKNRFLKELKHCSFAYQNVDFGPVTWSLHLGSSHCFGASIRNYSIRLSRSNVLIIKIFVWDKKIKTAFTRFISRTGSKNRAKSTHGVYMHFSCFFFYAHSHTKVGDLKHKKIAAIVKKKMRIKFYNYSFMLIIYMWIIRPWCKLYAVRISDTIKYEIRSLSVVAFKIEAAKSEPTSKIIY